jgi:hypothetical protein
VAGDCQSLVCMASVCQTATCSDTVKNQNETDVDCGGTCAPGKKCANGRGCAASTDCQSANCQIGVCQTAQASGLKAQYYCLDPSAPSDGFLQPALQIVNTSAASVPYSELKIRYWYTADASDPGVTTACNYSQKVSCGNISKGIVSPGGTHTNADRYLEIGFTAGAGSLAASDDSGIIQISVNRNSGTFAEANDYSYDATKTVFVDWTHVTLYRNGTLVWGTEP